MYKALSPGAIGVSAPTIERAVWAAQTGGFEGVEISPDQVIERSAEVVSQVLSGAGIRAAGWGLPVEWRREEETWRNDLAKLAARAKAAQSVGAVRCSTWVLPMSDERPLEENIAWHIARFRPIAEVLGEHGCSLGLEFIGPKTMRDSAKYPFVYTAGDMMALAREIGPNVGLLLDCWHWYTSRGTLEELRRLKVSDIVYVHVNDAPAGVDVDSQVDNVRGLPVETGVIDAAGFMGVLRELGYNGPVVPEPFKDLGGLPDDEARLRLVGDSMDKLFGLA